MPRVFGRVFGRSGNTPTPAQAYAAYVTSLGALLLYDGTLTADGTKIKNLGGGGDTYDGTPTDVTIDANGMNFNGTTSKVVIPDGAAIQALTVWSIIAVARYAGYGENNVGTLLHLGAVSSGGFRSNTTANGQFLHNVDTNATDANSIADTSYLTLGQTALFIATYDNGGDRIPKLYKGVNGTAVEAVYSAQTVGTGTLTPPVGAIIGNFADVRTLNGFIKSIALISRAVTADEMGNLATFAKGIGA